MTPLTHGAVGLLVCRHLRPRRLGLPGWAIALVLAFLSHFLLDAIPHLDAIGPLRELRRSLWLFLILSVIGAGLAAFLYKRNQDAGVIWLLLSVWLAVAGFAGTWVRAIAALTMIGFLALRTRRIEAPAYLAGAMLAIAGDMVPSRLELLSNFHDGMHFVVGWGTSLYVQFYSWPPPSGTLVRLRNPYFQVGYGLEFIVEAAIFLGAFWSFSRFVFERGAPEETAALLTAEREAEQEERAPV
jgi:hypothetical protein